MAKQRVPLRFRKVHGRFVPGNAVKFLRDGREAFPAMLEAIREAKRQVLLEMYWFDSDRIGRRFAAALAQARERGVEVALIYDAIGSITADRGMFAELEQRGVQVLEYNPVAPWRRAFKLSFNRLSRRDHRKVLVIDGNVGFIGGINIADQWLPVEDDGGGWRDDMMRIAGPAVEGLSRCFHRVWRRHEGPTIQRLHAQQYAPSAGERLLPVRILGDRYFRHRHEIARDYASRLYAAKRCAYIANSYFLPDGSARRALERAAKRGVDVRVLVPAHSDVEVVRYAARAQYQSLLDAGVRIFEWQQGMYHAKTAVIDGEWCTTGTFNFDYMSVRSNLEINASVLDPELAGEVEAAFHHDLTFTHEIDVRAFQARSFSVRLLESGLYRLRKFL
jgi:cardiolipin synthase